MALIFCFYFQLSGNFPALISSSVASLNPLPSFPSLNQSLTQSQGGKPVMTSIQSPSKSVVATVKWGMMEFCFLSYFNLVS
jgi:hypothetical protein